MLKILLLTLLLSTKQEVLVKNIEITDAYANITILISRPNNIVSIYLVNGSQAHGSDLSGATLSMYGPFKSHFKKKYKIILIDDKGNRTVHTGIISR